MLLGRLPAGAYQLTLRGQQLTGDARVTAELVHRPRGGSERVFAMGSGMAGQGITMPEQPGDMNITLAGPAVDSTCGDKLVLKLAFVAGGSPYREVYVKLLTP